MRQFLESMIQFSSLLLESDEELRRLERKARSGSKEDAKRYIDAKSRAGQYPSKTHREVDEHKYGLKSIESMHSKLLKRASEHEHNQGEGAKENYRFSDAPRHERRRDMFIDRAEAQPDLNAHNAAEQLHAWKRYMGLGKRLDKLSNRGVWRLASHNTDRVVHKFASDQGKHASRDPKGWANPRTTVVPSISAFERHRQRYHTLRRAGQK